MEKIHNIIETMDKDELVELKTQLEKGRLVFTVKKKLEKFKNHNTVCPVCNTFVGKEGFTLIFGPPGLRQKATFDGTDCLEYFLCKLKK